MAGITTVPRDLQGIRIAALELFEESLLDEERDRALQKLAERQDEGQEVANRGRVLESLESKRSLADGYYLWTEYLVSLHALVAQGFQIPLADLRASEVAGLRALVAARGEFEAAHPSCQACGALNQQGAARCRRCGQPLGRKPQTSEPVQTGRSR